MKIIKSATIIFTIALTAITLTYAQFFWEDDFEAGLGNWKEVLGEWKIESEGGNHYLLTPFVQDAKPAGRDDPRVLLAPKGEPVEIVDGSVQYRVKLIKAGSAGIILRLILRGTDVDHCYWFSVDSRPEYSFMLLRVDTDKPNQDGYNATGEAYGNELPIVQGVTKIGVWHDVKIELEGNHWKCYLDGKKLIDYEDAPKWAYTSGVIGFEIDCGQAAIDDVGISGVSELAIKPMGKLATTWSRLKLEND